MNLSENCYYPLCHLIIWLTRYWPAADQAITFEVQISWWWVHDVCPHMSALSPTCYPDCHMALRDARMLANHRSVNHDPPYFPAKVGRWPWCSGYSCLLGKTEMAGPNPTLAFNFQRNKMFLSCSRFHIVESLCDREVAFSASYFKFCVWRAVSSHSSHYLQEVLLAKFSLHVA